MLWPVNVIKNTCNSGASETTWPYKMKAAADDSCLMVGTVTQTSDNRIWKHAPTVCHRASSGFEHDEPDALCGATNIPGQDFLSNFPPLHQAFSVCTDLLTIALKQPVIGRSLPSQARFSTAWRQSQNEESMFSVRARVTQNWKVISDFFAIKSTFYMFYSNWINPK